MALVLFQKKSSTPRATEFQGLFLFRVYLFPNESAFCLRHVIEQSHPASASLSNARPRDSFPLERVNRKRDAGLGERGPDPAGEPKPYG